MCAFFYEVLLLRLAVKAFCAATSRRDAGWIRKRGLGMHFRLQGGKAAEGIIIRRPGNPSLCDDRRDVGGRRYIEGWILHSHSVRNHLLAGNMGHFFPVALLDRDLGSI